MEWGCEDTFSPELNRYLGLEEQSSSYIKEDADIFSQPLSFVQVFLHRRTDFTPFKLKNYAKCNSGALSDMNFLITLWN